MEESTDWITNVLECIQCIDSDVFTLEDLYKFEVELSKLHPNNKNIKAKIRQTLQVLRDNQALELLIITATIKS